MNWNFDNTYFRQLEGFYAAQAPERPPRAELVMFNRDLAAQLGLDLSPGRDQELAQQLSGAMVPAGADPIALAYAGHQFGHFSPQLGDGRAVLLGEIVAPNGMRHDLQLKGSGRTPFSRNGDGKLVLGPALREYLVSEAMAALGIPTTRTLSVVTTGESITRGGPHPGAVLARIAASHIRVGTFQFFAAHLGADHVRKLADYAIARHYPQAASAANPYLALLEEVMNAQIALVAKWISVGFVHGVMNTDNVSISGETIDYGPCAFIDSYAPHAVFSSIDEGGRYAFGNQPNICRWNMLQLASALAEIIAEKGEEEIERVNALLGDFASRYLDAWIAAMRQKLGLFTEEAADFELVNALFAAMEGQDVDYTLFFRRLADVPSSGDSGVAGLFNDGQALEPWLARWKDRIARDEASAEQRREAMNAVNPLYIPRNHKVEEALEAAENGDMAPFVKLLDVVTHPYAERDGLDDYAMPAPDDFGRYVTFCGT